MGFIWWLYGLSGVCMGYMWFIWVTLGLYGLHGVYVGLYIGGYMGCRGFIWGHMGHIGFILDFHFLYFVLHLGQGCLATSSPRIVTDWFMLLKD